MCWLFQISLLHTIAVLVKNGPHSQCQLVESSKNVGDSGCVSLCPMHGLQLLFVLFVAVWSTPGYRPLCWSAIPDPITPTLSTFQTSSYAGEVQGWEAHAVLSRDKNRWSWPSVSVVDMTDDMAMDLVILFVRHSLPLPPALLNEDVLEDLVDCQETRHRMLTVRVRSMHALQAKSNDTFLVSTSGFRMIVSQARTGSSLVTRLLSTREDTIVWNEPWSLIDALMLGNARLYPLPFVACNQCKTNTEHKKYLLYLVLFSAEPICCRAVRYTGGEENVSLHDIEARFPALDAPAVRRLRLILQACAPSHQGVFRFTAAKVPNRWAQFVQS